ncbi:monovalent cation/H(+) antiporter subunit G [Thermopolyspora sp. NPDC052614]|uniref:monovalent cation/H(+) antiporter subunit G n=1 Tax=Thermopolyspora sp. NPDC052614 TaxID=3155682 RepID=UPI0034452C22
MGLDVILDVAAAVCLAGGALLSVSAGVALLRFPDLLSRMHAATKPQVLGLLLVLLGCALRLRTAVDITTLVLIAVFQLATSPVAAHMIGRAGYRDRRMRADLLVVDELAANADRVGRQDEEPYAGSGPGEQRSRRPRGQ